MNLRPEKEGIPEYYPNPCLHEPVTKPGPGGDLVVPRDLAILWTPVPWSYAMGVQGKTFLSIFKQAAVTQYHWLTERTCSPECP